MSALFPALGLHHPLSMLLLWNCTAFRVNEWNDTTTSPSLFHQNVLFPPASDSPYDVGRLIYLQNLLIPLMRIVDVNSVVLLNSYSISSRTPQTGPQRDLGHAKPLASPSRAPKVLFDPAWPNMVSGALSPSPPHKGRCGDAGRNKEMLRTTLALL
jgi:hypothetical protein